MAGKLEQVYDVIRDVLDLSRDMPLDKYSLISKLVPEGLEPIELLEILHKLKVNSGDYCSGERLNDKGFDVFMGIVLGEGLSEDVTELGRRFKMSIPHNPIISVNDLAKYITPAYLERIVEYDTCLKDEGRRGDEFRRANEQMQEAHRHARLTMQ